MQSEIGAPNFSYDIQLSWIQIFGNFIVYSGEQTAGIFCTMYTVLLSLVQTEPSNVRVLHFPCIIQISWIQKKGNFVMLTPPLSSRIHVFFHKNIFCIIFYIKTLTFHISASWNPSTKFLYSESTDRDTVFVICDFLLVKQSLSPATS